MSDAGHTGFWFQVWNSMADEKEYGVKFYGHVLWGGGVKTALFGMRRGGRLKCTEETDADKGWIDIHAHILPGIDDGPSHWKESEMMLCMAREQGISHIVATPHFAKDQDMEQLGNMLKELRHRADLVSKGLTVSLGQEIMYFEELPLYLEQGKALTLAGSRYVLVEFLPGDSYMRLNRAVRSLVQSSFLPVVAHAERYHCLLERGRAEELVNSGAYLQVNAGSLEGGLLSKQAAWCRREILNGSIHFLATDMHGVSRRPPAAAAAAAWMEKQSRHMGWEKGWLADQIFRLNQEFIIRDAVL